MTTGDGDTSEPIASRSHTRRQFVKGGLALGLGAAAAGATPHFDIIAGARSASAQAGLPNNLVVIFDDLRAHFVGHLNALLPNPYTGTISTPNLDAFMAGARVYLNAYTPVPVCVGARSAILTGSPPEDTGLFGANHGFYDVAAEDAFVAKVLAGDLLTVPEHFAANGYRTSMNGKVFHGDYFDGLTTDPSTFTDVTQAFNDPNYAAYGLPGHDGAFLAWQVLADGVPHFDEPSFIAQRTRLTEFSTTWSGTPFTDFWGPTMPHVPRTVAQTWFDQFAPDDVDLLVDAVSAGLDLADVPEYAVALAEAPYVGGGDPRGQWMADNLTIDQIKDHIHAYAAAMAYADSLFGMMMNELDAQGLTASTNVIVTSDHGYHLGEKLHWAKGTLWEPSTRVPLAIRAVDQVTYPVGLDTRSVSTLDLAVTLCQLAGIAEPTEPGGGPRWAGGVLSSPSPDCVRTVWGNSPTDLATRLVFDTASDRFAMIVHSSPDSGGNLQFELYNLTVDPGEVVNLYSPPAPATAGAPAMDDEEIARSIAEAEAELDRRAENLDRRRRAEEWRRSKQGQVIAPENL